MNFPFSHWVWRKRSNRHCRFQFRIRKISFRNSIVFPLQRDQLNGIYCKSSYFLWHTFWQASVRSRPFLFTWVFTQVKNVEQNQIWSIKLSVFESQILTTKHSIELSFVQILLFDTLVHTFVSTIFDHFRNLVATTRSPPIATSAINLSSRTKETEGYGFILRNRQTIFDQNWLVNGYDLNNIS